MSSIFLNLINYFIAQELNYLKVRDLSVLTFSYRSLNSCVRLTFPIQSSCLSHYSGIILVKKMNKRIK